MKSNYSRICVVLATVILYFIPSSLHAGNFKIKPLFLTGDSAPDGGTFLGFGEPRLNSKGEIAFDAATSGGQGLYLLSEAASQLLLRPGEVANFQRLVDPTTLGITQVACPLPPKSCLPSQEWFKRPNTPSGFFSICNKNERLFLPLGGRINDSHEILLPGGTLVSGGSIKSLNCPIPDFLIDLVGGPLSIVPIGITNSGTSVLLAGGSAGNTRILLINGGIMNMIGLKDTPVPTGGTIQFIGTPVMNENEDLLVAFRTSDSFFSPQGLVFIPGGATVPVPLVFTGSDAPGGRTFIGFGAKIFSESIRINNIEQVVFSAGLSDGSIGIYRRDPDETIKVLFEDRPGFNKIIDFTDVRFMAINEKGEAAAVVTKRDFNFRATGDLLFFNSEGNASKVVSLNDAALGGAKFLNFGFPQVNNKGEVIFWAFLSNGKTGVFKASKGLETEFVDPVPDLFAGSTVPFDPPNLATKGRMITGIAADGAARVVVRVKTGQTGTVEFSLVDETGAALPPSNFNGSLSQVSEELGSGSVSVPAADVEGFGPMAFAAYHAPIDFATSPNSKEANDPDRKVFIKVKLTTSTGETVESTESIGIVRPPVVLVHGLWESLSDWNTFTPLVNDSNFFIKRANYNFSITGITDSTPDFPPDILAKTTTNALGFTFNASFVLGQIIGFIDDFKSSQQVAAIQADLVGHSMGGNVARNLPLIPGFFSDKTFGKGTIHKIVTIGTPHLGTPLATQLLKNANSCVRDQLAANENISFRSVSFQGRTFDGGVFELEGDGVGGALSRALRSLQQSGSRLLPTAMVAGVMSQAQLNGLSDLFSAATFIRLRCAGDPLANSLNFQDWPTIFGQDSDAIVPLTSQLNGLFGSRFTAVHSSGTVRLGFRPPHEYEEASNISLEVIKLLNASLTSGSFHLLPP